MIQLAREYYYGGSEVSVEDKIKKLIQWYKESMNGIDPEICYVNSSAHSELGKDKVDGVEIISYKYMSNPNSFRVGIRDDSDQLDKPLPELSF